MNFIPNWPMRGLCAAPGCRKFEASNPVEALPSTQSELPELKVEAHELLLTPLHCTLPNPELSHEAH
jgi:hypothetical protein